MAAASTHGAGTRAGRRLPLAWRMIWNCGEKRQHRGAGAALPRRPHAGRRLYDATSVSFRNAIVRDHARSDASLLYRASEVSLVKA
jgi:hypothetical protein